MRDEGFTLSELVDLFLYDSEFGYYASKKVRWGMHSGADYETASHTLSPVHGELLARHAQQIFAWMVKHGVLKEKEHFFTVEIGPGDGTLADDFMAYVVKRSSRDLGWRHFRQRLRYLLVDRAPHLGTRSSLLKTFEGQVKCIRANATDRRFEEFSKLRIRGLIFSNELLDNFAYERVRLHGKRSWIATYTPVVPRGQARRLLGVGPDRRVIGRTVKSSSAARQKRGIALPKAEFVRLLRLISGEPSGGSGDNVFRNIVWKERWISSSGHPRVRDALERLKRCRGSAREAVRMYVCPAYADFYSVLKEVLHEGVVLTMDYGGMMNFVAAERYPHMRVFGRGGRGELTGPGDQDITFDVDFGALMELGHRCGFETVFVGPQSALAGFVEVDLRATELKERVIRNRIQVLRASRRESEVGVDAEIEGFYRDRRSKLLVQVKGCNGMSLYG